jgi:diguanylate cyclase (GGDEF)-like protein
VSSNTGLMLEHFGRIAAHNAGTSAAFVAVFSHRKDRGPRQAAHGLSREQAATVAEIDRIIGPSPGLTVIPDLSSDKRFGGKNTAFSQFAFRFVVHINLLSLGGRIGFICLLDDTPRPGLTPSQVASLSHIEAMIIADRKREQRHQHLMHVADRALRVDRMLRVVSDAASCADALTDLLEELAVFHGAAIGRIWQLTRPDEPLLVVSRYQQPDNSADAKHPIDPLMQVKQMTVEAIRRNRPQAINSSQLEASGTPGNAAASGAFGYVCIPIWVQQQRFGVSLVFTNEDWDLDLVIADISSLADTIRPALLRKITEERIRFAAHHDDLTQLSNRLMFQQRLNQALAAARSGSHGFALLYLDLDGFKLVNDTLGHEMGDRLLVSVAERLRDSVRETDTVARMGGDEFAIIQQFGNDPSSASVLAERLLDAIAAPFELGDQKPVIGISIGIACYPQHGENPDLLLRNADIALYGAKKAGRNTFRLFNPEMQPVKQERFLVEQDLKEAIDGNELVLAFQPVCECKSLRIVGFEALMRWNNPSLGPIQPDRFIPLAEKSGLILPLGRWALEVACAEAATWDPPANLSVNLSPMQFRQTDLPQQIAEILTRTGLAASRLELEVTEGLPLEDTDQVLRTMRTLRAQGIRVTLDDFGTAYASLSYLRRFPFDGIKIDKSFIRGMCDDPRTLALVHSLLSLGERLNLAVVAEGVETERELGVLRKLGCRYVQGYLPGRPCESEQARALLRQSADAEKTARPGSSSSLAIRRTVRSPMRSGDRGISFLS